MHGNLGVVLLLRAYCESEDQPLNDLWILNVKRPGRFPSQALNGDGSKPGAAPNPW